jgi:hypothetical protein
LRDYGNATALLLERLSFAMTSSVKSLARAQEWMARAERAAPGRFKDRLERIARAWAELAEMAKADEAPSRR